MRRRPGALDEEIDYIYICVAGLAHLDEEIAQIPSLARPLFGVAQAIEALLEVEAGADSQLYAAVIPCHIALEPKPSRQGPTRCA